MRFSFILSLTAHSILFMATLLTWKADIPLSPPPSALQVTLAPIALKTQSPLTTPVQTKKHNKPDFRRPIPKAEENTPKEKPKEEKPEPKPKAEENTPKEKPKEEKPEPKPRAEENTPKEKQIRENSSLKDSSETHSSESSFSERLAMLENLVGDSQTIQFSADQIAAEKSIAIPDLLQAKIQRCWRVLSGVPNPQSLAVYVRIHLKRDGSLLDKPEIVKDNPVENTQNPYWFRAAEEALLAIEKCAPYQELPQTRYAEWSRITLRFVPEG